MQTPVLLIVLDLVGIFVFALSGGLVAVREDLDLFGVLVLPIRRGWSAPRPPGTASV